MQVLRSVLAGMELGKRPLLLMVEVKTQKNRLSNIDEGCEVTAALLVE